MLVTTVMSLPLHLMYNKCYDRVPLFRSFIFDFVGTPLVPRAKYPFMVTTVGLLQIVCSTISISLWWQTTYERGSTDPDESSEDGRKARHNGQRILNVVYIFLYFFTHLREGFRLSVCWKPQSFIDAITIVPEYAVPATGFFAEYPKRHELYTRWISLLFLRSWRALAAYERLENVIDLKNVSVLWRTVFRTILRTVAMVISMAGIMLNLEVLGEIPGWEDVYIETGMGTLSPWQMFYWIVTTISTVGYGDFSPHWGASRLAVVVIMVGGGIFFGNALAQLQTVRRAMMKGRGSYTKGAEPHVVVVGDSVGKYSSFMATFLSEILVRPAAAVGMGLQLDVVLLSDTGFEEEFIDFIKTGLTEDKHRRVYMFTGNAVNNDALDRVHLKTCKAAYVVPAVPMGQTEQIDGQNILRAIHMRCYHPSLRYKLMLLDVESRPRAVAMGLDMATCFDANEFKAIMCAQASRVKGMLPFIAGIFHELDVSSEEKPLREKAETDDGFSFWLDEYLDSCKWTLRGFLPSQALVGKDFHEAAAFVLESSNAEVRLIGAMQNGVLHLNWEGVLQKDQVLVALALPNRKLKRIANQINDWKKSYWEEKRKKAELEANVKVAKKFSLAKPNQKMVSFDGQTGVLASNLKEEEVASSQASFSESPITVIVPDGDSWPLVNNLLHTLRAPGVPEHQPVLVYSRPQNRPPQHLLDHYSLKRVTFKVGPIMNRSALETARVHDSQTVIVLRGQSSSVSAGTSILYSDHHAVQQSSILEQVFFEMESLSLPIYEFNSTTALRIFQEQHRFIHHSQDRGLTHGTSEGISSTTLGPGHEKSLSVMSNLEGRCLRLTSPITTLCYNCLTVFKAFFYSNNFELENNPPDQKLLFQWLFASGSAFTPDVFGIVFAATQYMPFAIDFIEALSVMSDAHDREGKNLGIPSQIPCPAKWAGKTFGELQTSWLRKQDQDLEGCGPVIVLAIYRHDFKRMKCRHGYHITLPGANFLLQQADMITVLGSYEFAKLSVRAQIRKF